MKKSEMIVPKENRNNLAVICHVLGILTFFITSLIIKKLSNNSNLKLHAKNALNWQINVIIYVLTGLILTVVYVGHFIIIATLIANISFSIIAALKAAKNELWSYPFSFQFLE